MVDEAHQHRKSRWEFEEELAAEVRNARQQFLGASDYERDQLKEKLVTALRRLSSELFGDIPPSK